MSVGCSGREVLCLSTISHTRLWKWPINSDHLPEADTLPASVNRK